MGRGDEGQLEGSHPGAVSPCCEAESLHLLLKKQDCAAGGAELGMAGVWEALPGAGTLPVKAEGLTENSV